MKDQFDRLWRAIKRLESRMTVSVGVPPSVHSANHSAGSSDPVDVTDLAGFPGGSPITYLDSNGAFTSPSGGGGGGGGDSTHTAAHASRPAASNAGDLFLPNNGFSLERDTGAAWVPWGPLYPFTAPVDGDFSWVNQGGATVSTTNGGIHLVAPANAGQSIRIREKNAPSTPYTITAVMMPMTHLTDYGFVHLGFRESSTGEIQMFRYGALTGVWQLQVISASGPSGDLSADMTYSNFQLRGPLFLQISDNGTNLIYRVSWNGQHWMDLHTVSRTALMAGGPDKVWFGADSRTASWDAAVTLLSWKEG